MHADRVQSPCIKVCIIGKSGACIGCGRTLSEIAEWNGASGPRKTLIAASARTRLAQIPMTISLTKGGSHGR